jgi:hypothetical protein
MKRHFWASLMLITVASLATASAAPQVWTPARVDSAGGAPNAGGYFVSAAAILPQPCYDVRIRRVATNYYVEKHYRGGMCTEVITTKQVRQQFNGPAPRWVTIYALGANEKMKHWNVPLEAGSG